jgi:phage baseplate assembly protein W
MDRYKHAIGVEYPIGRKTQGYFDVTYDSNENVLSCMRLFFSTVKGERRFNPEYGTSLWKYLFENFSERSEVAIKDIIQTEISTIFPQVILKNVVLKENIQNEDIYLIQVEIQFYSSGASTELQTLRFSNEM